MRSVARVGISLACVAAFALGKGPRLPVPEIEVKLDSPPEDRFAKVIQTYNASIWRFYDHYANSFLVRSIATSISKHRGPENDELQAEIRGLAHLTKIPQDVLHSMQMLYELNTLMIPVENITWPWDPEYPSKSIDSAVSKHPELLGPLRFGCTGIIAANPKDGTVTHARNLDFSFAPYLQAMTYIGIFTKAGKEVFRAQTIAGYSSILTGMRKGTNGFTVEINTRFANHLGANKLMFHNLFTEKRNFSGWTKRKILENFDTYEGAVEAMSSTPYIATEYNIISGVKKGTILARDPDGLAYRLNLDKNKYIIMTNFDYVYHDVKEWFDPTGGYGIGHPRRVAAEKILNASDAITPDVLFGTLNDFGVMANDTIFQALMNVQTGSWNVSLPACGACGRGSDLAAVVV